MKARLSRLVLLPVIVLLSAAGFFSYHVTREVAIRTSIFNLSPQLSDIHQWQKWNKQLLGGKTRINSSTSAITADGSLVNLTVKSPASVRLAIQKGSRKCTIQINLLPSANDTTSLVRWTGMETGFNWLTGTITGHSPLQDQLDELKKFSENPDDIYGFPMRIVKVADRALCITQKVVDRDSVMAQTPKMLNTLKSFLAGNSVAFVKNYYYLSFSAIKDQVELTVAVPVEQDFPARQGFSVLKFPADGRLLVGYYTGYYKDLYKVYAAMDKYMADHQLTKVAQVLESYPCNADFDKPVNVRVIYPIY